MKSRYFILFIALLLLIGSVSATVSVSETQKYNAYCYQIITTDQGSTTTGQNELGHWVVPDGVTHVYVLAVGGGGGGGYGGGGGGAGGYIEGDFDVTPGDIHNLYIGRGGTGSSSGIKGYTGGNSFFYSNASVLLLSGYGGGGGGAYNGVTAGSATGSGGGAGMKSSGAATPGTGGVQGNNGGTGGQWSGTTYYAGGGGGIGSVGSKYSISGAGNGGSGLEWAYSGITYAGGGGGGANSDGATTGGLGGTGGGGIGGLPTVRSATAGTNGLGGGGGGGGGASGGVSFYAGAQGGSGTIIIAWVDTNADNEYIIQDHGINYNVYEYIYSLETGDPRFFTTTTEILKYFLIGGGGAGGYYGGGGGGGGGLSTGTLSLPMGHTINITIGQGGTYNGGLHEHGVSGTDSTLTSSLLNIHAYGGGGGGSGLTPNSLSPHGWEGGNGGGGAGGDTFGYQGLGNSSIDGIGQSGGDGTYASGNGAINGGGGGGSYTAGSDASISNPTGANGGDGIYSIFSGVLTRYGGGGGGGSYSYTGGTGGLGGGGDGSVTYNPSGDPGTDGLGGGGGGSHSSTYGTGIGGDGIIIIKTPLSIPLSHQDSSIINTPVNFTSGTPESFMIFFGDGESEVFSGSTDHSYEHPGNYTITGINSSGYTLTNETVYVSSPSGYKPEWVDASSSFRKTISIDNPPSEYFTQIPITISYDSEMQSDFDDVRFYYPNGDEITYWIESVTSGVESTFWLKLVPYYGFNQTQMYYGDTLKSNVSNGKATFPLLFDDFSEASYNKTLWRLRGVTPVMSNGVMGVSSFNQYAGIVSKSTFNLSTIYTWNRSPYYVSGIEKIKYDTSGNNTYDTRSGFNTENTRIATWNGTSITPKPSISSFEFMGADDSTLTYSDISWAQNSSYVLNTTFEEYGFSYFNINSNPKEEIRDYSLMDDYYYWLCKDVDTYYYDVDIDYVFVKTLNSVPTNIQLESGDAEEKLTADFSYDEPTGVIPLDVQFNCTSTGDPTGWYWDFGDGGTSTLQNPSHTYSNKGNYTVALTVSNPIFPDDTETKRHIITTVDTGLNSGWAHPTTVYRKPVIVVDQPENTSYQKIEQIDYLSGMNVNFSDLRFARWGGDNVPYYIESKNDGSNTSVWIKLPQGDTKVYMYYGNASDTQSSADNTFELYDDFSGGSLDGAKWATRGDLGTSFTDGKLKVTGQVTNEFNGIVSLQSFDTEKYQSVFKISDASGTENTYAGFNNVTGTERISFATLTGTKSYDVDNDGTPVNASLPWTFDNYHSVFRDGSTAHFKQGNTIIGNVTNEDSVPTIDLNASLFVTYDGWIEVDEAIVRAFVWDEPDLTFGSVEEKLTANFTSDVSAGTSPLTVQFYDNSLGTPAPTSWYWDFGDGNISTQENPSHIYIGNGEYTVIHNATSALGTESVTKTDYIKIGNLCTPHISSNVDEGLHPLTVQFYDNSTNSPISWSWNFGDGNTSTLQNPSHEYSAEGLYSVQLTATNIYGGNSSTFTNYVQVFGSINADFSADPLIFQVPYEVDFTDLSSGEPDTWSWNFGDTGSSSLENPSHTYTVAGNYTVTLTASHDYDSDEESKVAYLWAAPEGSTPTADFTADPTQFASTSGTATFTDLSTSAYTITAWNWSFGDGSYSTSQNPSHTYNGEGYYDVSLTASNMFGDSVETKLDYIQVVQSAPTANFISDVHGAADAPLDVQFNDASTGLVDTWLWDFGDDTTSALQHPLHTYTEEGGYTVSLTASNIQGTDTESKPYFIQIGDIVTYQPNSQSETAANLSGELFVDEADNIWFEYGTRSGHYGYRTDKQSTDGATEYYDSVSGFPLVTGQTYYYRAVSEKSGYGFEQIFQMDNIEIHDVTSFGDAALDFLNSYEDPENMPRTITMSIFDPFIQVMGSLFFALVICAIYVNLALKGRSIFIPAMLVTATSSSLYYFMPPEVEQLTYIFMVLGIGGIIYWLFQKRRR